MSLLVAGRIPVRGGARPRALSPRGGRPVLDGGLYDPVPIEALNGARPKSDRFAPCIEGSEPLLSSVIQICEI